MDRRWSMFVRHEKFQSKFWSESLKTRDLMGDVRKY
jgi:hypothetical protein